MARLLLSGNEAVARGAWEAGATVGVGYPGTPSTETLEAFAGFDGVYAEWAPNEKVALEVAAGASLAGARTLATMKHVGLNVAADPLFTLAYTGVTAGLVILVADDPGMHSSQNEQDSRNYGAFSKVPVLEASDSAEALALAREAFEISERFGTPVLLRSTTRLSHSKGLVETGERIAPTERAQYQTDVAKWVMMPANARCRRVDLDARVEDLRHYFESSPLNRVEVRDTALGVVCSGVAYHYVREALPGASVFRVGSSFPLPLAAISAFASTVDRLVVVEEADDYLERSLRAAGIGVSPITIPSTGELSPGLIRCAFECDTPELRQEIEGLPGRPPLMCPGCPHRPVFHALKKARAVVLGDIGCYTLGALPPLSSMDSCVCMGASIGMAHGALIAGGVGTRPVVGIIGDSTFAHSGITGLLNTVYNSGAGTVIILDNRITAMTGHQGNPVNGVTLQRTLGAELELEPFVRAMGVPRVRVEDPQDLEAVASAIAEETTSEELSVIIFEAPCALLLREPKDPYAVDDDQCTACGACIKLGCPAIAKLQDGKADIDGSVCVGCGQCVQVCRFQAIVVSGPTCDIGGV